MRSRKYRLVTNGLVGDTFWLVAAHGAQADYVRNLQAQPRVRVKVGGVWSPGRLWCFPATIPPHGRGCFRSSGTRRSAG